MANPAEQVCTCWVDEYQAKKCVVHPGIVSKAKEPTYFRHARQHLKDADDLKKKANEAETLAQMYETQASKAEDKKIRDGLLILAKRTRDERDVLTKHADEITKTANAVLEGTHTP